MKRLSSGLLSLAIMLAIFPLAAHAEDYVSPNATIKTEPKISGSTTVNSKATIDAPPMVDSYPVNRKASANATTKAEPKVSGATVTADKPTMSPAAAMQSEPARTTKQEQNIAGSDEKMGGRNWQKLTPEERKEKRAMHKARMEEKISKLPPEQQAAMRAKMEQRHAERKAMHEKMKNMTPEQRHDMMQKWRNERNHSMHQEQPATGLAPAAQ